MPNCRSISPATWEHARECLVFYFLRRHGRSDAEDLAQETLLCIWNREDYEFEKEEDFLKICYGFARHISQQGYRAAERDAGEELDALLPAPQHEWSSQRAIESRLFLKQVFEIGQSQLRDQEWQILQEAEDSDRAAIADKLNLGDANKVRVRLHRARRKLAKLTGLE